MKTIHITPEMEAAHESYMAGACDWDMHGEPISRRSAGWPNDIVTFAAGFIYGLAGASTQTDSNPPPSEHGHKVDQPWWPMPFKRPECVGEQPYQHNAGDDEWLAGILAKCEAECYLDTAVDTAPFADYRLVEWLAHH